MDKKDGPVKFPGVPVDFGGDLGVLVVPALSLGQQEEIQAKEAVGSDAPKISNIDLIRMALSRNYPPLTDDEVKSHFDVGSVAEAIDAILNRSGVKRTRVAPGNT